MLSPYEAQAWAEADAALSAPPSRLARWLDQRLAPFDAVMERAAGTALGKAFGEAAQAAMRSLSQAAASTLAEREVCAALSRRSGARVTSLAHVARLPLEVVDAASASLHRKYVAAGLGEGAAAGMCGVVGLFADVPLLALLALRGVSETAAFHGFDARAAGERQFALQAMLAAAPVGPRAGADVSGLALSLAKHEIARRVSRALAGGAVEKLAQAVGMRLARAKLVQLVPVVSAALAGGLNAWYLRRVLFLARALYRQRFLLAKHPALAPAGLVFHG